MRTPTPWTARSSLATSSSAYKKEGKTLEKGSCSSLSQLREELGLLTGCLAVVHGKQDGAGIPSRCL